MWSRLSTAKTATTPGDRADDMRRAAAAFSAHLASSPGAVLSPRLRLGVAVRARDALLKFEGDDGDACPLGLYSYVAGTVRAPFPAPDKEDEADGMESSSAEEEACLATIVHSLINFQSKVNARWYADAIDAIRTCGVLSAYAGTHSCADDEGEMDLAGRAAFVEIVLLTAVSHGIHAAFLALGEDVPPLPTWEDVKDAPGPMNLRYNKLLRRVRRDEDVAAAPFFLGRDVDRSSPECSKVDASIWTGMNFDATTDLPWVCAGFSPHDADFLIRQFLAVYYLSTGEMMLRWDGLGVTGRHCPSVSRFDAETVAAAVADAHSCDF